MPGVSPACPAATAGAGPRPAAPAPVPGLYARVATNLGTFVARLHEQEAPKTAANFVGLAEGKLDPATGKPGTSKPFYNGLTFHRVVARMVVQGGDPKGDGTGGTGYRIPDEISPKLKFDRPGVLAMANSGPNTNGSQFFITLAPSAWLDGKYSIFGEVVEGLDVVQKISMVKAGAREKPETPVVIEAVTVERVPAKGQKD